jgi:leucyl aminopeptidase
VVELLGLPQSALDLFQGERSQEELFKGSDAVCSGVELARELVAAPPNSATPKPWPTAPRPSPRSSAWS